MNMRMVSVLHDKLLAGYFYQSTSVLALLRWIIIRDTHWMLDHSHTAVTGDGLVVDSESESSLIKLYNITDTESSVLSECIIFKSCTHLIPAKQEEYWGCIICTNCCPTHSLLIECFGGHWTSWWVVMHSITIKLTTIIQLKCECDMTTWL